MAGRRKGGKSKLAREGEAQEGEGTPMSDLLALHAFHALVFPLSFPFGRLPRRLYEDENSCKSSHCDLHLKISIFVENPQEDELSCTSVPISSLQRYAHIHEI